MNSAQAYNLNRHEHAGHVMQIEHEPHHTLSVSLGDPRRSREQDEMLPGHSVTESGHRQNSLNRHINGGRKNQLSMTRNADKYSSGNTQTPNIGMGRRGS